MNGPNHTNDHSPKPAQGQVAPAPEKALVQTAASASLGTPVALKAATPSEDLLRQFMRDRAIESPRISPQLAETLADALAANPRSIRLFPPELIAKLNQGREPGFYSFANFQKFTHREAFLLHDVGAIELSSAERLSALSHLLEGTGHSAREAEGRYEILDPSGEIGFGGECNTLVGAGAYIQGLRDSALL